MELSARLHKANNYRVLVDQEGLERAAASRREDAWVHMREM